MKSVLQLRQAEFLSLGTKVHFLYSEVVALYVSLCGDLMQGRLAGLPSRFRQAKLERESIAARFSRVRDFMKVAPRVVKPDMLAVDAVTMMESHQITSLFVVEPASEGRLTGLVRMHDLLAAKIV